MKKLSNILTEQLLIENRVKQSEKLLEPLFKGFEDEANRKKEDIKNIFDYIKNNDPSGNQKYLNWVTKQVVRDLKNYNPDEIYWEDYGRDVMSSIEDFHELQPYITNKDINSYNGYSVLDDTIRTAYEKKKQNELLKKAKKEADMVFENQQWKVVVPRSYESSCVFGAGTRWCTASKDTSSHYNDHMNSGILLYFIDKVNQKGNYYKFAFYIRKDQFILPLNKMNIQGFDDADNSFNTKSVIRFFPTEMQESIQKYINGLVERKKYAKTEFKIDYLVYEEYGGSVNQDLVNRFYDVDWDRNVEFFENELGRISQNCFTLSMDDDGTLENNEAMEDFGIILHKQGNSIFTIAIDGSSDMYRYELDGPEFENMTPIQFIEWMRDKTIEDYEDLISEKYGCSDFVDNEFGNL